MSDDQVTLSLIVLTHKVQSSLKKSYIDYLTESNTLDEWKNVKHIGIFSLGLFLVTTQFLLYSNRKNKTDLLDQYSNSMIKDTQKKFQEENKNITEEKLNNFVKIYQDYYQQLGSRFSFFLENPSPSNEFSVYYLSQIYGTSGLVTQIYLDRVISLNINEIREYIKDNLN